MRKILLLLCIILVIGRTQAQTEGFRTFSLSEAVDFAVKHNVTAKNGKLSEEEARARNAEIISMGLPQINANFDYTYYLIRPLSPAIVKSFSSIPGVGAAIDPRTKIYFNLPNNVNTGIQLNQLVFDGRYFVGLKATKALLSVSQLTTQLSEQDIRYNVTKGYYDCQAAKEIKHTLDSSLVIIEKILHDTREIYKQGLIEELDVNRLELAEANLQSQINNVQSMSELALSSLKFNMGLKMSEKIALTENIEDLRKKMSADVSPSFSPSQRIETKLLETSVLLKGYDMEQKKTGYYPNLYAFFNYGGGAQVDKFNEFFKNQEISYQGETVKLSNWFQQSYVGFSLKIPIWDGGQKHASVKQAKIEIQKAQNDLENFKNASTLQVEAAKTTFGSDLIEESNAKQSMALNGKIFNTTKAKFSQGIGSSFELYQSQQDLTQNQIRYINALKSVLAARADLDKALGVR